VLSSPPSETSVVAGGGGVLIDGVVTAFNFSGGDDDGNGKVAGGRMWMPSRRRMDMDAMASSGMSEKEQVLQICRWVKVETKQNTVRKKTAQEKWN
jgi:hypothetical protein